jgi:hypothetical protein
VFATLGLIFLLHTLAWLFGWSSAASRTSDRLGFLLVTGILFLFAAIAGLIGLRWIKKGSPPTPDMAIEEAKAIRETVKNP